MAATEKHLLQGGTSAVLYTDRRNFYINENVVKTNYTIITPFLTSVANWNQILFPKDPQYKMFEYQIPWIKQYFAAASTAETAADNAEDQYTITHTGSVGMPATFTNHLVGLKLAVHPNVGGKPIGASKGTVVVTTFTNATTISVKNLGSAAFTVTSGDWFVVIGTAFGEGTEAANPSHDDIQVVWNQCGIHKTSFQLTNTIMEASLRGESKEYDRLKKLMSQIHQVQKERDMLFSTSSIGTNLTHTGDTFTDGGRTDADGNTVRSTYGVFSALLNYGVTDTTDDLQNIFDVNSAAYSYADWVDQSEKIFEFNPGGIVPLYASDKLISFLNKIEGTGGAGLTANSKWTVNVGTFPKMGASTASRLGFNYRELESPHGVYQFIKTPTLTKSPYNGYGFAPDPENIFHVVYRKPMYQQNIKTDNAPDYQKNQYMSDEGMGMTNLSNHKLLRLT